MNDENQDNEALKRPTILTAPACFTVPGFGFLVALNPDWCFTPQERRQAHRRVSRKNSVPFRISCGGDSLLGPEVGWRVHVPRSREIFLKLRRKGNVTEAI